MPMDVKFMRQALSAIYYGDLLMTLRAQTEPYELEKGAAERLQNKWLDILCDRVRHGSGYSGREMRSTMPKIASEFAAIPQADSKSEGRCGRGDLCQILAAWKQ